MSDLTKNGATSVAQSTLPNRPTPVADKQPPDLKAQYDYHKQLARDFAKRMKAEAIKSAAKKAENRKAREAEELEAVKCRIYKTFFAAGKNLGLVQSILDEFKTNSIDQHYTLAAMKARADAKALAEAEKAGVDDLD